MTYRGPAIPAKMFCPNCQNITTALHNSRCPSCGVVLIIPNALYPDEETVWTYDPYDGIWHRCDRNGEREVREIEKLRAKIEKEKREKWRA